MKSRGIVSPWPGTSGGPWPGESGGPWSGSSGPRCLLCPGGGPWSVLARNFIVRLSCDASVWT